MQVKLIALAVAGLMAAPVFAQSNVTVYGRVDLGYKTLTNDSISQSLDQESSNRWGLMGEEDLGGGLKAFFQLENRFFLDNGNTDPGNAGSGTQWKDKAWVGLSGGFGKVYLGRNASVGYALYGGGGATSGGYEAFGGDTISSAPSRRARVVNIWNNSIRYDSPVFGPAQLFATYSLNEEASGGANAYALGTKLAFGKLRGEVVYQKDVGDNGGGALVQSRMFKTAFVTAGYAFGSFDVFGGYARSKGYNKAGISNDQAKQTVYQIGTKVPVGQGVILANIGKVSSTNAAGVKANGLTHVGLGYWYLLSKRTTLMANAKYDKQKDAFVDLADNQTGIELAVRHSF